MRSINLPFPGFLDYDSDGESLIDHINEHQLEIDVSDLIYSHWGWSAVHQAQAKTWCDVADSFFGEAFEETRVSWVYSCYDKRRIQRNFDSIGMRFEETTSPREYNFETDRLFALVPDSFIRKLWRISKAEKHIRLQAMIENRFTSRSGFISYYPNRLADWPADLLDWDYNQLGTLLLALIDQDAYHDHCVNAVLEESYQAFDRGQPDNWDSLVQEAREEKFQEWLESDPDAAKAWAGNNDWPCDDPAVTYRCKLTRDLFEGVTI